MKIGLALPYNQSRSITLWAQLAEQMAWDGLFLGDAIWCEDPMLLLAAAAVKTSRIRLGTMIIPVPLRRPWKIASESIALDLLSEGRLILGLGTGATWMGWQGFPDEVTDPKTRTEMLEETMDILTVLHQSQQADYQGKHYHLRLTLLDEMYYPPKTVQQPRIPVWIPAICAQENSLRRALKGDGVIVEKRGSDGTPAEITPKDIAEIKGFVDANRSPITAFDIVVEGRTSALAAARRREKLIQLEQSGATWWIEGLWGEEPDKVTDIIQQGPPILT